MYYTQCMREACFATSLASLLSVIPQPKFSVPCKLTTSYSHQGSSRSAEIPSEERQNPENKESDANGTRDANTDHAKQRESRALGNQRCGSGQEILEGASGSRGKMSFPCVVWDIGKDLLSYFSMMSETSGIPFLFFFFFNIYLFACARSGFPDSSVSKESSCDAEDLGLENPQEKGMTTHSSIFAWEIPMDRGTWQAIVHGVANTT